MMKERKIAADSYQTVITVFHRTKAIPRPLRATLGRKMEESALTLLLSLRQGLLRPGPERYQFFLQASQALDDLRILSQVAKDLDAIPASALAAIAQSTQEIGKELGGLLKYEKQRADAHSSQ